MATTTKAAPRVSPMRDLSDVPPSQIAAIMAPFAGDKETWQPLPPELMPNPRSENFVVTVGVAYILGSFSGLTIGAAEGLYLGMKLPGTRLKLNAMLNAMGKRGAKAGNAIASLALLYSGMSWFLNYTETPAPHPLVDTEAMRAATSAACAGALYRLPMGFGPSLTFATIGAASMYGAIKIKQKYHPAPFNPSIKDLWQTYKGNDDNSRGY